MSWQQQPQPQQQQQPQHRGPKQVSKRPPVLWLLGLLFIVALSALGVLVAYHYTPQQMAACQVLGPRLCEFAGMLAPPPPPPSRPWLNRSDDEIAAYALAKGLKKPRPEGRPPKLALLFLTVGALPFELLWERFLKGHEDLYSVYVHASDSITKEIHWKTDIFRGRLIRAQKVHWGQITMIDAERRLLTYALLDEDNGYFVLLSDSCVPLHGFDYTYNHLMSFGGSFVDCFDDPGPHGRGRYLDYMSPQIAVFEWRKGAQWFAVNRHHATLVVADHVYYRKFKLFCKPGDTNRNCYPDEHYLQTFLHIMDPSGIANWTVTHVDWSEGKWHPKSYTKADITPSKMREIQAIDEYIHKTSNAKAVVTRTPCLWNGQRRPCFLFARKFQPETAELLLRVLPNSTWVPFPSGGDQ